MEENKVLKNRNIKQWFLNIVSNRFSFVIVSRKKLNDLEYFKDTAVGLYTIDQNPKSVSYDWILKNNFRIKEPSYKGTFL